jgi:hypothetical protein
VITIVAQPTPPTLLPPPPNPANSPFGHYLLHPGQETSVFVHHVLRALAIFGRAATPFAMALVALVVVAGIVVAFSRRQGSTASGQLVTVAPGPEVDAAGAEVFWNALHGVLRRNWRAALLTGRPHVSFEVSRSNGRLRIGIWVPPHLSAQRVANAVEAAWPSAVADVMPTSPPLPDCATVAAGALRLADKEWFPIRAEHPADPHRVLLRNLGGGSTDAAVVQVLARPASLQRQSRCRSAATALRSGQPTSALAKFVRFWTTKGVPTAPSLATNPFLAGDIKAISAKQSALCFEAAVHYAVGSRSNADVDRRRLRGEAQGIVAGFAIYDGRNRLARKRLRHPAKTIYCRRFGRGDLLSVPELAALAHVPTDRAVAGLSHAGAHVVAPPPEVRCGAKVLGHAETGDRRRAGLEAVDARQHVHVLGTTGSGKSTLITNLVLDDFEAKRGAVVVDPKGDLVDDILDRLPERTAGRVVVLDPNDAEAPPTMNVLDAADPHLAVDHLVGIFHRLFEAYWGPRTDDVLRVAALTALGQRGATLADIPRLLTEPTFRAGLTRRVSDRNVKSFWDAYERMTPAAQSQMVGPVMNKLRVVLTRPFVAAVLGSATSSFRMGPDILDGGLLLARLPKGQMGEDSCRLLGSFVVARVWQAVTARARTGQHARADAALYLDECQNFLTLPGSIADMLAEARGYRLSIVAAHQNLTQLPRELREALSANARNKVIFNCSPEDAHALARHTEPEVTEYDLSNLGRHQAAARLVVDLEDTPAFTLRTEPAPDPVAGRADAVRIDARASFGRIAAKRRHEDLKRSVEGRPGDGDADGASAGTSLGRSAGISSGALGPPGRGSPLAHDGGGDDPADGDPDSWSDL